MASAPLLVSGNIFKNLRSSQKILQHLQKSGHIRFTKYPISNVGSFRRFYRITEDSLKMLGKHGWDFHEIKEGTLSHDSLTALFLIHLFRWSEKKGLDLRWHSPCALGDKICDGRLSVIKDGKIVQSFILETDRGTHDHQEIIEKLEAYLPFLIDRPNHWILFLVSGEIRKKNLYATVQKVLHEENRQKYHTQIKILSLLDFHVHLA